MEGKNQLLGAAHWPPYMHYGVFVPTRSLKLMSALSFFIQQISHF